MQLSEYLAANRITHRSFGDLIGASQAAVSRYCSGARFPERDILRRIDEVTKGIVTANDFVALAQSAAPAEGTAA